MTQGTETASQTYDRLVAESILGWVAWRKEHPEATREQDDVFPEATRAVVYPLLDTLEGEGRLVALLTEPRVWCFKPDQWAEGETMREFSRRAIFETVVGYLEAYIDATEPPLRY